MGKRLYKIRKQIGCHGCYGWVRDKVNLLPGSFQEMVEC